MKRSLGFALIAAAGVAVCAGGIALALNDGEQSPTEPVVQNDATASRDTAARRVRTEYGAAQDIAPANECSVSENPALPKSLSLPPGAGMDVFTSASFAGSATKVDARTALINLGAAPEKIQCSDFVVEPGPAAAAAADDAETSPPQGGEGSCFAQGVVDVPAGTPKGVNINRWVSGSFMAQEHEPRMTAILANLAGVAPAAVECDFYVPPAGMCFVELQPGPDDPPLPTGATINGSVSADYREKSDQNATRATVAAMARVERNAVSCEDFDFVGDGDVPAYEPEPLAP